MAGITLEQAERRLKDWMCADEAVSKNQAYSLGDRSFTRADAAEIRQNIEFWQKQVKTLDRGGRGGMRVRYGVSDP